LLRLNQPPLAIGLIENPFHHGRKQFEQRAVLPEIIPRPMFHHADGHLLVALPGDHDEGDRPLPLRQHPEQVVSGHVRQLEVEEHERRLVCAQPFHDRGTAAKADRAQAFAFQPLADQRPETGIIVHDQDWAVHHCAFVETPRAFGVQTCRMKRSRRSGRRLGSGTAPDGAPQHLPRLARPGAVVRHPRNTVFSGSTPRPA